MSGHRLSRLLAPSPRGRPYVLVSVCKGILYFFNTQKKFQEIFKKYLILLILNELQRAIFRGFFGVSVVKRFNGIILYIGDLRPWRSPCPVSCRIPGAKPHHIKPFYFSPEDSGRYDWPHRKRQTKLKRFNPGSPWRMIWTGHCRPCRSHSGREEFLQGRDSSEVLGFIIYIMLSYM